MRTMKNLLLAVVGCVFIFSCTAQNGKSKIAKVKLETEVDSVSYAIGSLVAEDLKRQGLDELSPEAFAKAIYDIVVAKQPALISPEEARTKLNAYSMKKAEAKSAAVRNEGIAFLEKNKTAKDVQVTESGLQYKIVTIGEGAKPTATNKVRVHYHGTDVFGDVFDSSVERGQPAEFPVNGVIKGWVEGLQLMPVGSKFIFYIPSELAYGEAGAGQKIPPGSTLLFEVELLEIL